MLLLLLGCSAELLPGALAIPGQAPAVLLEGPPGFGNALAWVNGELAIGGGGELRWADRSWQTGPIKGLWPCRSGPCVADGERILDLVQGTELARIPGLRSAHGDPERWLAASATEVLGSQGSWALEQATKVWVGERDYALACPSQGCGAYVLERDATRLGESGPGAALAEHHGALVWGAPELDLQDGAGAIHFQEGGILEGDPGEHLGAALCPGFGAGHHNLTVIPNQSRVRSLDGGLDLALEAGVEGGLMVLACGPEGVAVGQPSLPGGGRVWVLQGWP